MLDRKKEHKPGVLLPSAIKLRLWLLPYPCYPELAVLETECETFVEELGTLLETFLTGELDVLRWPRIAEDAATVSDLLNTSAERLCVATNIGKLARSSDAGADAQRSSAVNLVRVSLALKLIKDGMDGENVTGKDQRNKAFLPLREVVNDWTGVPDEAVQDMVNDWKRTSKGRWYRLMHEE